MSNNTCSDKPPKKASAGDLWYNTTDNEFYVFDENLTWVIIDNKDEITEIIMKDDDDDPVKAYDRAMGVI